MKPNQGRGKNIERTQWVTEITSDAVRHFAWGIGDNNPLWVDQDYELASGLTKTIAPPSFTYAIDETTVAPGLHGYERHYEKVEWEWFQRLELGDQITSQSRSIREERDSSADVIWQHGETLFNCNHKGLVAKANVVTRRDKKQLVTVDEREEINYTPAELSKIEETIIGEESRGYLPRHWEGVSVGDSVGVITKGPLSIMDIVAWCAGTMGSPDGQQGYSSGGLDDQTATGPQLAAWIIHLLTNWMGDGGFLHTLSVNFSGLPSLGSTTTISGNVSSVFTNKNKSFCEIDITCLLQNGEEIANGNALIQLPSSKG